MIWYIFPLLAILYFSFYDANKYSYRITFVILALTYCSGYMTGSDWRAYELWYNDASIRNIQNYNKEFGYYYLMLIFKGLNFNFFLFTIFIKSLCLASFYGIIKKYSLNYKDSFLSVFSLVCLQGAFLFVNCPFRNVIAIGVFLYAFNKFYNSKFYLYIIFMLLAYTIHSSALIILIFTIIYKIFHTKFNDKKALYFYLIAVILSIFPQIFKNLLENLKFISNLLESKIDGYVISEDAVSGSFLSIGSVFNIVVFYFIYKYRKELKSYNIQLYHFTIIALILYRLSMIVPIFSRFYLFFIVFYIISIVFLLRNTLKKYYLVWFVYCFLILVLVIRGNYAYLPYTNYWKHLITDDLKSYYQRDKFNIDEWYKKYKKLPGEK